MSIPLSYAVMAPGRRWGGASRHRMYACLALGMVEVYLMPHYLPEDLWSFGRFLLESGVVSALAIAGVIYGIVALWLERPRKVALAGVVTTISVNGLLACAGIWVLRLRLDEVAEAYRLSHGVLRFFDR